MIDIRGIPNVWGSDKPNPVVITAGGGSQVHIIGASGTGKSDFCRQISGLADAKDRSFEPVLDGRTLASRTQSEIVREVGFVPTDPTLAFSGCKSTLRGELNLAWRITGHFADPGKEIVANVVRAFQLDTLLERDPFTLSGGEAVRAALALALIKRPKLLVLDQAIDQLDVETTTSIDIAINAVLPPESVIVETRGRKGRGLGGACVSSGSVQTSSWQVSTRKRRFGTRTGADDDKTSDPIVPTAVGGTTSIGNPGLMLDAVGLSFRYGDGGFELRPVDLSVAGGERIAIMGPNGVGKTTLLKCLALLLKPSYSKFEVRGKDRTLASPPEGRNLHEWARNALYSFQRPEDQLYLPTVSQELVETSRRIGNPQGCDRAFELARLFGLERHLEASPFDLPRGYKRVLTLVSAIAAAPPVLLLDEPTVGLDDTQVEILAALLKSLGSATATIMVSHDAEFVRSTANTIVTLSSLQGHHGESLRPAASPIEIMHS